MTETFDDILARLEPHAREQAEHESERRRLAERGEELRAQRRELLDRLERGARDLALGRGEETEDTLRAARAEVGHVEDLLGGIDKALKLDFQDVRRAWADTVSPAEVALLEALTGEADAKLAELAAAYREWLDGRLSRVRELGVPDSTGRPLADFLAAHVPAFAPPAAPESRRPVSRGGVTAEPQSEAGRRMVAEGLMALRPDGPDGKEAA